MKNRLINIRIGFIAFFFFSVFVCGAQETEKTPADDNYQVSISKEKMLSISFSSDKKIAQLLIIVFDETGQTVFLDNQYDFIGKYSRKLDLKTSPSGIYSLRIAADDEKVNKTVEVK